MGKPLIPIAFPSAVPPADGTTILAADIGGTKTDMAIFEIKQGAPSLTREFRYASRDWPSLEEIVRDFTKETSLPQRLCISFAGPIRNGKAHGTNLHWDIDAVAIGKELGIEKTLIINDLEANCYGLAALTGDDFTTIYPGKNGQLGNAAVISPGTGLGEGGLFWDGQAYHPFATEGGHAHFAPRNEFDWDLFRYLQRKYGHVSWERVVSGPGICMIFSFLRDEKGWEMPEILREEFKTHDTAAAISLAATEGCSACAEALRRFIQYLAEEAANLALKLKATGGVFIGGGILPQIWNEKYQAIFNEFFFEVGRLNPLVEEVPVHLILNPKTALWGAGYYGAFGN